VRFRGGWSMTGVLALCFVALNASADDPRKEQSRTAFRKGVELVQKGDLRAARDAFVEAYRLFPHPSILLNLGLLRARTGEYLEAEHDLVGFLADDGGATRDEVQSARAALADARTHIGTLKLRVEPAGAHATLDGKPLPLAAGEQTEARMLSGDHVLEIAADGYKTEKLSVRGDPRQPTVVELTLAAEDKPVGPPPGKNTTRVVVGASLLGAGGVSLIIGIACGARAIALANGYNDPGSDDFQKASVKSDGISFRTTSDVTLITGLVLAGVGVGFLLWPTPKTQVVASPNWIGVRGTF
jgi:hypothetical protein